MDDQWMMLDQRSVDDVVNEWTALKSDWKNNTQTNIWALLLTHHRNKFPWSVRCQDMGVRQADQLARSRLEVGRSSGKQHLQALPQTDGPCNAGRQWHRHNAVCFWHEEADWRSTSWTRIKTSNMWHCFADTHAGVDS